MNFRSTSTLSMMKLLVKVPSLFVFVLFSNFRFETIKPAFMYHKSFLSDEAFSVTFLNAKTFAFKDFMLLSPLRMLLVMNARSEKFCT